MYSSDKLDELSQFARVRAGSRVMDVWPGSGEWTRRFSEIAGPAGRVYSFVPAELAHFKSDPIGQMRALAKQPGRENVEVVSADLVALPCRSQSLDVVWLHLFYHDLHTALLHTKGATAAGFNRAVHERLKPGGFYVIVDHVAAPATGASHAESLHRIEPAVVREEVEAAGFALEAESTVLANKDDPHSARVFDPSIKGRRIASAIGLSSADTRPSPALRSALAGVKALPLSNRHDLLFAFSSNGEGTDLPTVLATTLRFGASASPLCLQ